MNWLATHNTASHSTCIIWVKRQIEKNSNAERGEKTTWQSVSFEAIKSKIVTAEWQRRICNNNKKVKQRTYRSTSKGIWDLACLASFLFPFCLHSNSLALYFPIGIRREWQMRLRYLHAQVSLIAARMQWAFDGKLSTANSADVESKKIIK